MGIFSGLETLKILSRLEQMEKRIMARIDAVLAALAKETTANAASSAAIATELKDVQLLLTQMANNPGDITDAQLAALSSQIGANADAANENAAKLQASAAAIEAVLTPANPPPTT